MGNIGKIYSRKRFVGGFFTGNKSETGSKNGKKKNKLKIQIIKLAIILIMTIVLIQLIFLYFEPIFETMCEEKVKSLAILITNQQSTIVMNK